MTSVTITITGARAEARKTGPLTSGMVGVPVQFVFDPQWEGLHKIPVFKAGNLTKDNYLREDASQIPHEVLCSAGEILYIGVEGRSQQGDLVIPTVWAAAGKILPGAQAANDEALAPTPSQFERFMAEVEQVEEKIETALQKAKQSGEFNGEKGDPGYSPVKGVDYFDGEKGDPGYTPVKGLDYFTPEEQQQMVQQTAGLVSADWNAAEGEPGYIRNRTHWEEGTAVCLLEDYHAGGANPWRVRDVPCFIVGETYTVIWNGVKYACVAQDYSIAEEGVVVVGWADETSTEPFQLTNSSIRGLDWGKDTLVIAPVPFDTSKEVTLSIYQGSKTIHTLDPKYLPTGVPSLQTAAVGQTIVVKAVDENGVPTQWEAADMASGGSGNTVYATIDLDSGQLSMTLEEVLSLMEANKRVVFVYLGKEFEAGEIDTTKGYMIFNAFLAERGAPLLWQLEFDLDGALLSSAMYMLTATPVE